MNMHIKGTEDLLLGKKCAFEHWVSQTRKLLGERSAHARYPSSHTHTRSHYLYLNEKVERTNFDQLTN